METKTQREAFQFYEAIPSTGLYFERPSISDEMEVRVSGDEITQVGRIFKKGVRLEPRMLRDQFLAVGSQEQAVTFLQLCGPFLEYQPGNSTQTITWQDFQAWQGLTRRTMLNESGPWPKRPKHGFDFFLSPEMHYRRDHDGVVYFRYLCRTALEIIGASIAADKVLGVTFKACPLCGKIFEAAVHGGHEKRYCTPEHSRRAARERATA